MLIYLGLGANVGNRLRNLQSGLRLLGDCGRVVAVSALYETEPVGPPGQQPYWNAAASVETDRGARALLPLLKRIEWQMGRRPGERWGSRPLDMDILLEDELIDEPDLVVPHPHLAERPFVLAPLVDVAPELVHPLLHQTVAGLLRAAGDGGVRRIAGPEWLTLRYLREPEPAG